MTMERKERSLEELYNLTDRVLEPEITPVLRGSFRIQGPVDELDHDKWRSMEASPAKKKIRRGSTDDSLQITAKSGTCNMCATPCTSCMHFSQTVSVMESKIEDEHSGEICKGKEDNHCSSSDADVLPLFKSRACERQLTASETSNLLSASSSHDSISENTESKATMKNSNTAEVFEDVEMLPMLSSGRNIDDDELHARECNIADQGVFVSSHEGISLEMGQQTLRQYEGQQGLECHDDNISCVTGVKDVNVPVCDHNVYSDRKNVSDSSASVSSFLAVGFEKAVQHQSAPDFITGCQCEMEESQRSSSRPTTCSKHSFRNMSSGITSETVSFSHKSDPSEHPSSNDVYVKNSMPKLQPPYCHSQSGNFFFGLGDSEEHSSFQTREGPSAECSMDHVESSLAGLVTTNSVDVYKFNAIYSGMLPNTEDSKESLIRNNSSGDLMKIHLCLETDINVKNGKPPEMSVKSSDLNQQFEKSSASLETTVTQKHLLPSQLISKTENSASDIVEDDVKVCDICGDTGREEMLAICSRCSDGAEHTYCMQVMLDKVPKSDWLCEECSLKEDAEMQKVDKTEVVSETPKAPCLNEKGLLTKLENKAQEEGANQAIKDITTPEVSSKEHVANLEVASNSNKEAVDTRVGSPGTVSSSKKYTLSRESSFKNSNVGRVKPAHPVPSSGILYANSSQEPAHSLTASGPNASWMQERLQSTQGSLSRSATFNNSKTKVKHISEDVSQKRKMTREFANSGTRKERSIRTFSKSISFKSTIQSLLNTNESKAKLQSPNISCSEDSRGLKQAKEQNIIERKFFRSGRPLVNSSPTAGSSTSLTKEAQHDGRLSTSSKSTIFITSKGPENVIASDGNGGVKKKSSFLSCDSVIPSSNGMGNSDEQKPYKVGPRNDTTESSWAVDESHGSPEILRQDGLPQIWESMNHDGKTKDPLYLSWNKQNVTSGGKSIQCHRCKEMGHVSQFCTASPALKASAARSTREVTNKSNKWKDVVAVAMSNGTIHKGNELPDQVVSRTDLSYEVASKDMLPSYSNCLRHLTKTDGRRSDVEWRQTHADLNVIPPVSDETKFKPYMMSMPIKASILGNPLRISAIPEHDYIWQGGFEVHRSGSGTLPVFCDGIQAHLSTCASPKVLEVVNKFSHKVHLKEVSHLSVWPMQFRGNCVTENSIALFFFAKDLESYESYYKKLLENMLKNDLALKGNFDGIELLIFPSNCLPEKSQRWNRLFFLWAVFRGRINCSASSAAEKKLCGATVHVEPLVEHRPTPVKVEVPISQKISMQEVMDKELSIHYRLPKETDAGKSGDVDLSSLSSSAGEDGNYTKASSLDQRSNFFCEITKSSDGLLLSEITSYPFPEIRTSVSVRHGLPGTRSLSGTMTNNAQLCSDMKSSSTSLKEVYRDPRTRKVAELQPYSQATNAQIGVDKAVPMNSDTSNCRQSALIFISPDRQDASSDSSKIFPVSSSLFREASVTGSRGREEIDLDGQRLMDNVISLEGDLQAVPIAKEQNSWELRSSRKRPCVNSSDTASEASVETSTKTTQTVAWRENNDGVLVDGKIEYKKRRFYGDSSWDGFSSKMCDLHPSFQNKELKDACNHDDSLKTAERYFFPVDPSPIGDLKSGSIIPWKIPLDDANPPESDSPNLDLALGAEKKPLKREVLPLIVKLEDERSNQNKLLDQATGDVDNDASSSLSLSLAFPFSEKEQTAKSVTMREPLLPERHHVNTSLLLFGGLTDT